jgi:hypothetical protein
MSHDELRRLSGEIIEQWRLAMIAGDESRVGHLVSLAHGLRSEHALDLRIGSDVNGESAL